VDGNVVELIAFDESAQRHAIAAMPDPGIVDRVERQRSA
jgi:hypothetical protein